MGGGARDHFSGLQFATLPSISAVASSSVNLEVANVTPNFTIGSGSGNLLPIQSVKGPFLLEESPSALSFITPSSTEKRTRIVKRAVQRGKRF